MSFLHPPSGLVPIFSDVSSFLLRYNTASCALSSLCVVKSFLPRSPLYFSDNRLLRFFADGSVPSHYIAKLARSNIARNANGEERSEDRLSQGYANFVPRNRSYGEPLSAPPLVEFAASASVSTSPRSGDLQS